MSAGTDDIATSSSRVADAHPRTQVAVIAASETMGGAERYLNRLYASSEQSTTTATLYGHIPGWTEEGLPQVEVPFGPKWGRRTVIRGALRAPRERQAVTELLRRSRPDVTHMQFKREQIALTGPVSKLAPVIWTEHGPLPGGRMGGALSRAYARAARRVDVIVCVSEIVAESVSRIVAPTTRLEVMPNAIDTRLFTPALEQQHRRAKQSLGFDPDEPLVLWLGRLDEGKLPELAARALGESRMPFLMCGGGPLQSRVTQIASDFPAGRVLPFHPAPQRLFAAADALLFTTDGRGEGFPTVLIEASAASVPIVMNLSSGFGHIAEAAGGVSTSTGPGALADALRQVVHEPLGHRAVRRAWAEQFDIRVLRQRHDRLVQQIVR